MCYKEENTTEGNRLYQERNKIATKGMIYFFVEIYAIQARLSAVLRDFRFTGMSVSEPDFNLFYTRRVLGGYMSPMSIDA
jgi:hypothetical protein